MLKHLLGNGDAWLENFGVVYNDWRDVSLAPFHDCLSIGGRVLIGDAFRIADAGSRR